MLVNKKQLADIFGISERMFTDYQKDPSFPYQSASRGHKNEYETAEVHKWLIDRAVNGNRESAKERLDRLRGDSEELKIAQQIEETVPSDELDRVLTDVVIAVRNTQMHSNPKLKKTIDQALQSDLDIEILNAHSREVLSHLSGLSENFALDSQRVPEEIRTS